MNDPTYCSTCGMIHSDAEGHGPWYDLSEFRVRIDTLEAELDRRDRQDKFNRGVKEGWPHD